jgi:hypothetical protein
MRARVHYNLGLIYLNRVNGKLVRNREKAFRALNKALLAFDTLCLSIMAARTRFHLARLLISDRSLEKSARTEKAISLYEAALAALDPTEWGFDYAAICFGAGKSYFNRWQGLRTANLERADWLFTTATELCGREKWPELWHNCQLYLALLHGELARSGIEEHCTRAKEHRRLAYDFDKARYPDLWEMLNRLEALRVRELELRQQLDTAGKEGKEHIAGEVTGAGRE